MENKKGFAIYSNQKYSIEGEIYSFSTLKNRFKILAAKWGDAYGENASIVLVDDEGAIEGICTQWGFFERDCPGHGKDTYTLKEFRECFKGNRYEEF